MFFNNIFSFVKEDFIWSSNLTVVGSLSQYTTQLEVIAGTWNFTGGIYADKIHDLLYIRPSCDGYGCQMFLGGHDDNSSFHMSDEELDRLSTEVIYLNYNTFLFYPSFSKKCI